jgi:hypothetical protein
VPLAKLLIALPTSAISSSLIRSSVFQFTFSDSLIFFSNSLAMAHFFEQQLNLDQRVGFANLADFDVQDGFASGELDLTQQSV